MALLLVVSAIPALAVDCTSMAVTRPQFGQFAGDPKTFTFDFTASPSDCSWTVTSFPPWVYNVSPTNGTGNATITYTILANDTYQKRVGYINVSSNQMVGFAFAITQNSSHCTFGLDGRTFVPATEGNYPYTITTNFTDCGWFPEDPDPWISVGGFYLGTQTIPVGVAQNTGLPRSSVMDLYTGFLPGPTLTIMQDGLRVSFPTSLSAGTEGVVYGPVTYTATNGTPPYTWAATGLPNGLGMSAGGVLSGTPLAGSHGTYTVNASATDSNQNTTTSSLSLTIYGPLIITSPASLPAGAEVAAYGPVTYTATGGTGVYMWAATGLPNGLAMSAGGVLSGTPAVGSRGTYTVNATVTDSGHNTATSSLSLTIYPRLIITSPTSLPAGNEGLDYGPVTYTATGGTGTYTWAATGLPNGLAMSAGGVLNGTLAAGSHGTYTVNATVTDSVHNTATSSLSLIVNRAELNITSPVSLSAGTEGVAYLPVTYTATGGTGVYNWTATGLPGGLAMSSAGVLSGTPAAGSHGTYAVSATVTDSAKANVTNSVTLTIAPALVITVSSSLPPGMAGNMYSQQVTASGGTPPYTFSIVGSAPPGLTMSSGGVLSGIAIAGTYTFTVQTTDSLKVTTTKVLQLTIAPGTALLQVSASTLDFAAVVGGDAAPPQTVTILPTGDTAPDYAVQVDGGGSGIPAPSWLTVKPLGGAAPGRLIVIADPGKMIAGTFRAGIHITVPQDSTQAAIDIGVSFTISTHAPQLEVSPASLRFAALVASPGNLEQTIVVRNSGGGGPLGLTISTIGQSPWIAGISPSAGSTAPNVPVLVRVRVNTQGLDVGYYHGLIRIDSAGGFAEIPVVLIVSDHGPIISLNVTGLRFQSPMPQAVSVLNLGEPGSIVNWSADLLSGTDWLNIANPSGTSATNAPGSLSFAPTGPAATGKYALVRISDPHALNSPQYLTAVEDNVPASPPQLDFSTAGLFFAAPQGSQPVTQTFQVFVNSLAKTTLQTATATDDGSWLKATPKSVAVTSQNPAQITVTLNPAGLTPGVKSGTVAVSAGGIVRMLNVTLVVTPPASVAPPPASSIVPHGQANAVCMPNSLAVTQTGMANNFAVPAGWPSSLMVQLNDDCGSPVTNGSVVASFSNGDAPVPLSGDQSTNVYSATWQPGVILPQITITIRASAGLLQPVRQQFIGTVDQNNLAPPTLAANGTLEIYFDTSAAARLGAALAPGTVAQVYGTGLAASPSSTGTAPLPPEFRGTFMLIGGLEAPLFYVSPSMLNVQIPFELKPGSYKAVVSGANGALTEPEIIDIVPYQPSIAAFPDGTIEARHNDPAIPACPDYPGCLDAAHPAKPGETLTIYLAGLGATNPPVKSGDPTPSGQTPSTVRPKIFVDGQEAEILYAGLTPADVGRYQIDFVVPADARTGTLDVVVTQNGIVANATTLPVVR